MLGRTNLRRATAYGHRMNVAFSIFARSILLKMPLSPCRWSSLVIIRPHVRVEARERCD
jgi:hypothetical protein